MKKVIYATIIVFVTILIIVVIIAERNVPTTVTYKNGKIVEDE